VLRSEHGSRHGRPLVRRRYAVASGSEGLEDIRELLRRIAFIAKEEGSLTAPVRELLGLLFLLSSTGHGIASVIYNPSSPVRRKCQS